VEFVVDSAVLGQVFSNFFGFFCQFSFHRPLHIHHLSSGAGTIGQTVADVPSGLSLTPLQETKKNHCGVRDARGVFIYQNREILLAIKVIVSFK
jgi:hypothetical protein